MKSTDISMTVGIFIVFGLLFTFAAMVQGIQQIENNWPEYRCHPGVIPFAKQFGHDPMENFTYCIQNMQGNYMGYLIQPVYDIMGNIQDSTQTLGDSGQSSRGFTNYFRGATAMLGGGIFDTLSNALIVGQNFTNIAEAIVGNIKAIMYIVMYTIETTVDVFATAIDGPIGYSIKALQG